MKPCPFCGTDGYSGEHTYHPGKYIVRCGSSGLNCPFFPSSGPIEKAHLSLHIKYWNERSK